MLTLQGAMGRPADFKRALRADIDGFSLHAAIRCGADDDRRAMEQLCRDISRPTLAIESGQSLNGRSLAGRDIRKATARRPQARNVFGA